MRLSIDFGKIQDLAGIPLAICFGIGYNYGDRTTQKALQTPGFHGFCVVIIIKKPMQAGEYDEYSDFRHEQVL